MKNKLLLALSAVLPLGLFAEGGLIAELMTVTDKMFVVVIVLLIILAGIIFFLTLLEKRVKKLENKLDQK